MVSKSDVKEYLCEEQLSKDLFDFSIKSLNNNKVKIKKVSFNSRLFINLGYYSIDITYLGIDFIYRQHDKNLLVYETIPVDINELFKLKEDLLKIQKYLNNYDFSQF